MKRSVLLIVLGFTLGCMTVIFWPDGETTSAPRNLSIQPESVVRQPQAAVTNAPATLIGERPQSLAELAFIDSEFEQSLQLYFLLKDMNETGLLASLDDASVLEGDDYLGATSIIFGRLAELDPELAVEEALGRSSTAINRWISSIFHSWARLDLDAALLKADTLVPSLKQVAARAIVRSRNDLDSGTLKEIGAKLGIGSTARVTEGDIPSAWAKANTIDDNSTRIQTLARLAAQWGLTDPQQALLAAESLPNGIVRTRIEHQIVIQWAQNLPQAALDWTMAHQTSPGRGTLIQGILTRLAQVDLEQARSIADSLTGKERDHANLALIKVLASQDLDAATYRLSELSARMMRLQAIQSISKVLIQRDRDLDEADRWLQSLPPDDRQIANAFINSILANTNPQVAAQRIEAMADEKQRSFALRNLVQGWSGNDPAEAIRWVEAHDSSGEIYESLTSGWAQWSPSDALAYARTIRNQENREYALLGALRNQNADEMELIVSDINDPDLKQRAAQQAYRRLAESHPDRAEALRETAGLDMDGRQTTPSRK